MHPSTSKLSKAMINLQSLIDEAKCYEAVRALRWPEGGGAARTAAASQVTKQGRDATQPARQKYRCTACERYFDDLTGTMFAGPPHHLSLFSVIPMKA
jgi:transposase-like protein